MMRRWLTCFSIGIGLGGVCANAASVSGVIELASGLHAQREQAGHLNDIVVWLESLDAAADAARPAQHAQMLQKDKMFHPHVLPIVAGTTVDFPNADPIFHNAFSNYDGQLFDVALYAPGTSRAVVFRKPGIARVFCNIHPSMSAIILVLKTPNFAKVNAAGEYRIPNVPAGEYELHYYDERATDEHRKTLQLTVESSAAEVSAPIIHISEASYVSLPHKNKYGHAYPPEADSYNGGTWPPK